MPRPSSFPWWRSWLVALRGLGEAVWIQRNLKIHVVISPVVIALAAWLRIPGHDWPWVIACIGAVLAAELLNTSIEAVVDLASPEHHELARQAKDFAAAGVLVTSVTAALIGVVVLGGPLWKAFRGAG